MKTATALANGLFQDHGPDMSAAGSDHTIGFICKKGRRSQIKEDHKKFVACGYI